jgi:transcriptional regulator with XRE-family HTH domain
MRLVPSPSYDRRPAGPVADTPPPGVPRVSAASRPSGVRHPPVATRTAGTPSTMGASTPATTSASAYAELPQRPLAGAAPAARESIGATLARNVVVARLALDVTQHRLAAEADVSRATIAQVETGVCDPRVSTVTEIARGLGLPPALLLLSADEIRALIRLADEVRRHPVAVDPTDAARMRALLETGLLRDRNRAARMGADLAREAGGPGAAPVAAALAAIFSAVAPGPGTAVGAMLGRAVGDGGR